MEVHMDQNPTFFDLITHILQNFFFCVQQKKEKKLIFE